jgi:hypothetical protein
MNRFLIILPMLLAASAASADMASLEASMPRIDISNMDCAQVQSELQSQGKAILWWHSKTGMPRYGKYVSSDAACKMQQFRFRTSVATTDTKSCRVHQCNTYGRPANH